MWRHCPLSVCAPCTWAKESCPKQQNSPCKHSWLCEGMLLVSERTGSSLGWLMVKSKPGLHGLKSPTVISMWADANSQKKKKKRQAYSLGLPLGMFIHQQCEWMEEIGQLFFLSDFTLKQVQLKGDKLCASVWLICADCLSEAASRVGGPSPKLCRVVTTK